MKYFILISITLIINISLTHYVVPTSNIKPECEHYSTAV